MTNVFGIETGREARGFDGEKIRALLRSLSDQELIDISQASPAEAERRVSALLEAWGTVEGERGNRFPNITNTLNPFSTTEIAS